MIISPRFLSALVLAGGAIGLPAFASAQGAGAQVGVSTATAPPAEQQWTAVKCGTCEKAGVILEVSRSQNGSLAQGFVVARVRNLTSKEVRGSIEVHDAELPDAEGYAPSQLIWYVLGPLGNEKGEQVILLPYMAPASAIAYAAAHY